MIELLQGKIARLSAESLTLLVSGVGFRLAITPRHSLQLRLGQEVELVTKMIVREDDISLFGFSTQAELESFDLLCSVNGIGPKSALNVLAGMDANEIANAVNAQDDARFRAISGIGPKTAKLIVISLANKVGFSTIAAQSKVLDALLQLGTEESLARRVIAELPPGLDDSSALKAALVALGNQKLAGR